MYNAITLEARNIPTATLVSRGFSTDARSARSNKGMPGLRYIAEDIASECTIKEQIDAGIDAVIDDIVAALTQPPTEQELHPKPPESSGSQRIVFGGDLSEVNRFFYRRGWTDGLPVIPPTEQAVREMLAGTDLPPDHIVGKVPGRLGKATVEKIAVNAVMAGCLPTYMPLLIAGVECFADPRPNVGWSAAGTGAHTPFWIVNGPISRAINANSSSGYLSPGNIANASIGRALSLILKNVGGNRQGIEDMGVHGHPGKYSQVVAENEADSPWEPLHAEYGFDREDSAITLFSPDCFVQFWPYGTTDKGILNSIIYNTIPARWGLTLVVLPPVHAKTMASKGWTKKEIASFISEYSQVPAYRHPDYTGEPKAVANRGEGSKARMPLSPEDRVRIIYHPEWIRVVVAGGPGNYISTHIGGGGFLADWVTKKVQLPSNWEELVGKYRNMVPNHVTY